jgi:hypothetical protein
MPRLTSGAFDFLRIQGECSMKSYTYSEARGIFATVLEEAERDGAVEIRRRDGAVFRILSAATSKGRSKASWTGPLG